ncbi:uncharacterized protein E0L32_003455 [Thyridium curvatum]|uniref:Uncharacterized protein n=1 Tax=Thyridium curvatum TaxID=1093900 RepID=A0A507BBL6_9PEZI|nr:uncharacterized protein E0L32_003455 [Thyridium curvatum]TPX16893.1 hypothetical protein E0L32_003455 [Thyridium curvatum]
MCLTFYCDKAKPGKKNKQVRTCRKHKQCHRRHHINGGCLDSDEPDPPPSPLPPYRYYNYSYDLSFYPGYGNYAYNDLPAAGRLPADYYSQPPRDYYSQPPRDPYLMHTALPPRDMASDDGFVDHVYYRNPPPPPPPAGQDAGASAGPNRAPASGDPGGADATYSRLREGLAGVSRRQEELEEKMERARRREREAARREEAERILQCEAAQREGFLWGRNYEREVNGGGGGGGGRYGGYGSYGTTGWAQGW